MSENITWDYIGRNPTSQAKPGIFKKKKKLKTKKNNDFEIKVREGNSLIVPVYKDKTDGIIDFDFFNTDDYQIEIYEKLPRTAVEKNAMLKAWLVDCKSNEDNDLYVMLYDEEKNGKMEYTYILYYQDLGYVTNLQTIPTGNKGELKLEFDFVD